MKLVTASRGGVGLAISQIHSIFRTGGPKSIVWADLARVVVPETHQRQPGRPGSKDDRADLSKHRKQQDAML